MDCQEKVTPKILPARILVTGSVAAIENEISCFILDLRLAFLEDTTSEYLSVHVFLKREQESHREGYIKQTMPHLHDIVSVKGRILDIDEN
jgi:hypothetical protein